MLTKQKKIAAIITFAAAGFFCGFFGIAQTHAAVVWTNVATGAANEAAYSPEYEQGFSSNTPGDSPFGGLPGYSMGVVKSVGVDFSTGGSVTLSVTNGGAGCPSDVTSINGTTYTVTAGFNILPIAGGTGVNWSGGTNGCRFGFSGTPKAKNFFLPYGQSAAVLTFYDTASGPTTASTTLDTISPSGTIASSSPITITITGHLGTNDLASTTAAGNTVRLLSWVGGVDTAFISPNHTWTLSTDGSFTQSYQVTTDLPAGNFKIYASITSAGTYDCSAIDTGGVCVPIGGINVASTTYFTLNSSYFEHITGTSTPTNLYTPQPCGISDLSGCFQNALAALFYPTVSPGAAFQSISQTAQGKAPFVYVYQIASIRNALFTSSSTAPTSVDVPLWKLPGQTATSSLVMISSTLISNVPYASTVKLIITAILWLMMAEYVYYRVIRMHDTTTPS